MDQYERFTVGVDGLADLFAGYRQVLLRLQEELGEMGLNRKLHEMRTIIENCKPLQGDLTWYPGKLQRTSSELGNFTS